MNIRPEGHGRWLNLELDLAPLSFRVTEVGLAQGFPGKEKGPTCCLSRSCELEMYQKKKKKKIKEDKKETEKEKKKKAKGKRGGKQGHSTTEDWPVRVSPEDYGEASGSQGGVLCHWCWVRNCVNQRQPTAGIEKDKFRLKIAQPKIPMKAASSSHIWRRKGEKKKKERRWRMGKTEWQPAASLHWLLWPAFKQSCLAFWTPKVGSLVCIS